MSDSVNAKFEFGDRRQEEVEKRIRTSSELSFRKLKVSRYFSAASRLERAL